MTIPDSGPRASRLVLASLLCILPLFPPEARGESLAGSAALIVLLTILAKSDSRAALEGLALAAGAAAVGLATCWPGASLEPVALWLLAGGAGVAAVGLAAEAGAFSSIQATLAVAGSVVGLHAVFQKLWGLRALREAVVASGPIADREAVLGRLAEGRAFAGFATPAAMSGFLAMSLAVTLGLAVSCRGRRRGLASLLAAVQVAGLLAGASATAAGALAVAAAILALKRREGRRGIVALVAPGVLVVAIVALLRGEQVLSLLGPDSAWRLRAGNFRAAAEIARDHPWVGVGPGGFGAALPAYLRGGDSETRYVHNLPLELVAELGFPAAAILTIVFFWLFLGPLLARPSPGELASRTGARVALAAFAIQNVGDFTAFLPSTLWVASLLRGLISGAPTVRDGERAAAGARGLARPIGIAASLGCAVVLALSGFSWNARFLAREALAQKNVPLALRNAERAAILAPWNADAAAGYAEALLAASPTTRLEDNASALREADRAVALAPTRPGVRILRARARAAAGDLPGAYADASEAARLYPRSEEHRRFRDEILGALLARERREGAR